MALAPETVGQSGTDTVVLQLLCGHVDGAE